MFLELKDTKRKINSKTKTWEKNICPKRNYCRVDDKIATLRQDQHEVDLNITHIVQRKPADKTHFEEIRHF